MKKEKIQFVRKVFYKIIWWHDYLEAEKNPYLKQTYLNMINSDLKDEIKKINLKTFLIWWEKDTYTPLSDWNFMSKNIKNSHFIILKNQTHWIHLKNPELLSNTFLDLIKKK
jgi:pimeloyl-ACP methyl ester carboxylesterase